MSFIDIVDNFNYDNFNNITKNSQVEEIRKSLYKNNIEYDDLLKLLSINASILLKEIAYKAREITIQRFGKTISFYVPVYLSNECNNSCIYCGFNISQKIKRKTLNFGEIEMQFKILKKNGFNSVLLLTGEAPDIADIEYISRSIKLAKKYFTYVALEIYPLDVEDYTKLVEAGASGLTIYQETYDKKIYEKIHKSGKKKDYKWRLNAPERAAQAGFRRIGIGSLLGLSDWRFEASMLALHIDYLKKKYWKLDFTLSFPRINQFNDSFNIPYPVNDKNLIQLICALRLCQPNTGFLLSTREPAELRDRLLELCITQISAGSKTNPGGYSCDESGEQFNVADSRDLNEMIKVVKSKGYEAVLKDWDDNFLKIV